MGAGVHGHEQVAAIVKSAAVEKTKAGNQVGFPLFVIAHNASRHGIITSYSNETHASTLSKSTVAVLFSLPEETVF